MLSSLAMMGPHRDSLEYKGTHRYQSLLLGLPQWLLGSKLSWWEAAVSKVGCRVGRWELISQLTLANSGNGACTLSLPSLSSSARREQWQHLPHRALNQIQSCRFESQEHCTSSHKQELFLLFPLASVESNVSEDIVTPIMWMTVIEEEGKHTAKYPIRVGY